MFCLVLCSQVTHNYFKSLIFKYLKVHFNLNKNTKLCPACRSSGLPQAWKRVARVLGGRGRRVRERVRQIQWVSSSFWFLFLLPPLSYIAVCGLYGVWKGRGRNQRKRAKSYYCGWQSPEWGSGLERLAVSPRAHGSDADGPVSS